MAAKSLASIPGRAYRRIQSHGLRSHLLGLLVRWRFQRAGIVLVAGGWSLPIIENQGGRIELGNTTLFSGVRLEVWKDARLAIGSGTFLNRNTEVVAVQSVSIGEDCMIARDVLIMDSDQHEVPGKDLQKAPVVIEDRVWIGARAIVLKGVTIGHDSVIGAGAIVTKSVPPRSVVVGTAARIIRTLPEDEDATSPGGSKATGEPTDGARLGTPDSLVNQPREG